MKHLLVLAFTLSVSIFYAQQRITVIDKNAENSFLFDEQNPQSLFGLFNRNSLPFNPMSEPASWRQLEKGFLSDAPYKTGYQSDVPLSTIYGEDSLIEVNGVLQYVYPMYEVYYIDLHDVSRILLYEHDTIVNGKQHYLIDSIGYAKKYTVNLSSEQTGGKYELAGTIPFKAIDKDYQLFYAEEFSSVLFQQLIAGDFLSRIKTNQINEDPMKTRPVLNWDSGLSENYNSTIFEILQPNRPQMLDWNDRDFLWPITESGIATNSLKDLEGKFGKGHVYGFQEEESNIPLATIYGEDSTITLNGLQLFVYPEPVFYPTWIDVQPTKAWAVYSVSSEDLTPKNKLERIIFTDTENVLLADFNCSDPRVDLYTKYLEEAGIQLEVPVPENWKTALLKARLTGKHYSVSKKGAIKKLAKEFEVIEDVVK